MSDLGINSNFKGLMTLLNNKSNKILEQLDSQKNGKHDGKISIEDVQLAAKNSKDSNVKEMANYILDNPDFMENLRMNPNNKKSYFTIDDAVNLSVDGKINASGDDLKNANSDYEKRNAALSIISQHKDELDSATHGGKPDGNFDTADFYNLSKSDKASQEVKDAAKYIVDNPALLHDIDGTIDKHDGISDGKFSWGDFQKTQKHAFAPGYEFKDYKSGENPLGNGAINQGTNQQNEGDCATLSSVRALSETDKGKTLIHDAIKKYNDDGSADVSFPSDPDKTYHVTQKDINDTKYAKGDKDMQIVAAALDQKFKENGGNGITKGEFPDKIFEALDGGQGRKHGLDGKGKSPDEIKKFLTDAAPHMGKDYALTLIGDPNDKAGWKPGGGHAFQISGIDTDSGQVTYTNPWDSDEKKTISIDDLANQMSKDGGYFQGRDYSPAPAPSPAATGIGGSGISDGGNQADGKLGGNGLDTLSGDNGKKASDDSSKEQSMSNTLASLFSKLNQKDIAS